MSLSLDLQLVRCGFHSALQVQRLRLREGEVTSQRMLRQQLGTQGFYLGFITQKPKASPSQHPVIHAAWLSREVTLDPLGGGNVLQKHHGNISSQWESSVFLKKSPPPHALRLIHIFHSLRPFMFPSVEMQPLLFLSKKAFLISALYGLFIKICNLQATSHVSLHVILDTAMPYIQLF